MTFAFVKGIDISSNQGQVDWRTASQSGISFAFARATIGGHQIDSQFGRNWSGIRNAGLVRGAYHYFWPLTPWRDQANNFITTVGDLQAGDLAPVLDLEEGFLKADPDHDVWSSVSPDQRLPMIRSWLNAVEGALGMSPMIYTRQNFIEKLLGNEVQQLADSLLWIAHYGVVQPSFPGTWSSWTFWQSTDSGTIDGIDGKVDFDNFNGLAKDLQALAKS